MHPTHVCWGMVLVMHNNVQYKLWNNKWSERDDNGLAKRIGNFQMIQSRPECNPLCTPSGWSTLYVYHQYTMKLINGLVCEFHCRWKVPLAKDPPWKVSWSDYPHIRLMFANYSSFPKDYPSEPSSDNPSFLTSQHIDTQHHSEQHIVIIRW